MERILLVIIWIASLYMFAFGVRRNGWRQAAILFSFAHLFTWPCSLLLVEMNRVEYPVREFVVATEANFTLNFVLYPCVSMIYSMLYPRSSALWVRIVFTALFVGAMTGIGFMLSQISELVEFPRYPWYARFGVFLLGSYLTRKHYEWFFCLRSGAGKGRYA